MSRRGFNLCILVFLVVNDYIVWLFFKERINPLGLLLGIQVVAWLIANAFYEVENNKQFIFCEVGLWVVFGLPFLKLKVEITPEQGYQYNSLRLKKQSRRKLAYYTNNALTLFLTLYVKSVSNKVLQGQYRT